MGKDPREKANSKWERADKLFAASQYKKAGKYYDAAGELFLELHDYEESKKCYFKAAESFLNDERYESTIEQLRNAASVALLIDDYSDAHQFYKSAVKYIPHLKKAGERDFYYILFGALSYLCNFIDGKQDKGIHFLKVVKKKVDNTYFKENPLIKLVKNLSIAIRDKNAKYLKLVEQNFDHYQFREAEGKLMKEALVVAKSHISIITELLLDKKEYTTKDSIILTLRIDTNPLIDISKYPFYNYTIEKIRILDIGITISDNLTAHKRPVLPMEVKSGEIKDLEFIIKPHFQVDKPFIGPILLTCEIDEKYIFYLKTQRIKPNIITPPPSLDISATNLKTPLIGQTFPLEFLIENNSQGDALNIELEAEFPPEMKVMRGTLTKQIYSLSSRESMTWELNIKPLETGDFEYKMKIKFKDPDQNQIEEEKTFDFSIQL